MVGHLLGPENLLDVGQYERKHQNYQTGKRGNKFERVLTENITRKQTKDILDANFR